MFNKSHIINQNNLAPRKANCSYKAKINNLAPRKAKCSNKIARIHQLEYIKKATPSRLGRRGIPSGLLRLWRRDTSISRRTLCRRLATRIKVNLNRGVEPNQPIFPAKLLIH